jgi:hypothetical protein
MDLGGFVWVDQHVKLGFIVPISTNFWVIFHFFAYIKQETLQQFNVFGLMVLVITLLHFSCYAYFS